MLKSFTTLSMVAALLSHGIASAQSVGINMDQPNSTLDVNGSLAAKYNAVTATSYTMTSADFHTSYNGTADATFTLPAAISGPGNFKGRMYVIKNNTSFTVTVNPAASETINGSASIAIGPNQSLQLISTGLTGAASTWEVSGNNLGPNVTASNGLTAVGNDVRLGGTLLQNTAIDYVDKALYLRSNVDGFGLTSIGNVSSGTNASALLQLTNNAGSSLDMFLNSSLKTADGGPNVATIRNMGGLLTLKGNGSSAAFGQVTVGTTGFKYYYADGTNSMLDIDGNGDIYMNRPEPGGVGGNKVWATKGHLDLIGTNTGGTTTSIYLGTDGFKYTSSAATKTTIDPSGNLRTAGSIQGNVLSSLTDAFVGNNLSVTGTAYALGFVQTSDMRLKTQVKEIGYGLSTIMALQPKQYELSTNNQIMEGKPAINPTLKTEHKVGFLAQDLYKVVPEAVHKPKDDTKEAWAVDYAALVPALTKAIQDQQAVIEQERERNRKLEAEIQAIKKKLGM